MHEWVINSFTGQSGFAAFSYFKSQLGRGSSYIMNQEEHHHEQNFKEEYFNVLRDLSIDHQDHYLFNFIEG